MVIRTYIISVLGIMFGVQLSAQSLPYKDTLCVEGGNWEDINRYASYYIDTEINKSIQQIEKTYKANKFFRAKQREPINMGLNPYPLWLHLIAVNTDTSTRIYWWSFYTQADSVFVYEKLGDRLVCIDTLSYNIPPKLRNVPVRFLTTVFRFKGGQRREFFTKTIHRHTAQNFITDFTTPASNIIWEKDYYWKVGSLFGCFMLVVVVGVIMAYVNRNKIFFVYSLYLLCILILILIEELLIGALPQTLFVFINRIPSISLVIIALTLRYPIIQSVQSFIGNTKSTRIISFISKIFQTWGILIALLYFLLFNNISLQQPIYVVVFKISIAMACVMPLLQSWAILIGSGRANFIRRILFAVFLLLFNPILYYLYYEGMIPWLKIDYATCFYVFLSLEIIILSTSLIKRYNTILKDNSSLLEEKIRHEAFLFERESEVQMQERKRIAMELHDSLGSLLSVIKLNLSSLVSNLNNKDALHEKILTDSLDVLKRMHEEIHTISHNLTSSVLERYGLREAILNLQERINTPELKVNFYLTGIEERFSSLMETNIYRIIQELLQNIIKHAKATEASIEITRENELLIIIAEDNGVGINALQKSTGMGLYNIKNRIEIMKGTFEIDAVQKQGTTIIIEIPISKD